MRCGPNPTANTRGLDSHTKRLQHCGGCRSHPRRVLHTRRSPGRQRQFSDIPTAIKNGAVFVVAFDLLYLNGNDLRRRSLEERKEKLTERLDSRDPRLQFSEVLPRVSCSQQA